MKKLRLPGFTYIELMMVMGILVMLLTLVNITIVPAINRADTRSQANVLLADLFSQQQKSMQSELGSGGESTPFGIYFQPGYYVLFQGTSYVADQLDNYRVDVPDSLTFSAINLPDNTVMFSRITGEVIGYNSSQNTVTLSPLNGGVARVIQLNRYGVVELY